MLNTKKFLYILPDSAYIAELLPTKKPHSFSIHSFRQINGDFIDENEFLAENVEKLIKKIEPEEYTLILPDFLFTNTIVDVQQTEEGKVKEYLKNELLPGLGLSKDSHEIDTFILTQHQGKSKVQLSALEKSLLDPIRKAAGEQKLEITAVSPLSWTIKSVISLEPSLSTIQIGGMLYLAQHYIGIDQTISFKIEETENIVETVKTLKGAEPNIQTLYLLTNLLVENDIKEKLSGTLPIQQLANYADEQEGIPSYIKQIIEAGAKTSDIAEYPVPKFNLGAVKLEKSETTSEKIERAETVVEDEKPMEMPAPSLPPQVVATPEEAKEPEPEKEEPAVVKLDLEEEVTVTATVVESVVPVETTAPPALPPVQPAPTGAPTHPVVSAPAATTPPIYLPAAAVVPATTTLTSSTPTPSVVEETNVVPFSYQLSSTPEKPMTDQFSSQPSHTGMPSGIPSMASTMSPLPNHEKQRPVIKNKSGVGSMMKMVAVTVIALVVTVGIGVGVGFGLLSYSEKKNNTAASTPTVTASPDVVATAPSPVPSPSLSPTPAATPAKTKAQTKVLIVNATGIAGRAGKLKQTLIAAGYKTVDTGNAAGTYTTKGMFVLMPTNDAPFIAALQKDAGVTLTYNGDKTTEDTKSTHDVVIVINQ